MTSRGVLVTGWHRAWRVVGKVRVHHLFFLHDARPEHQEIEGETEHKDYPRSHDQCQPD
jgi:hypothetical protein